MELIEKVFKPVESETEYAVILMLTGGLITLTILVKWGLGQAGVPALVGYLGVGFLLRWFDAATGSLPGSTEMHLGFLANIGVVALLFRVGLDSNLKGLLGQLRKAQPIWLGDVLVSGGLAYLVAVHVLGFPFLTSLYVTVALTATSVGVSVAVWRELGRLNTPHGQLLVDVAELDDISAVVLMSLLFAVGPALADGWASDSLPVILQTSGWVLLKLLAFGVFCYLFSRFAERPMTRFFERIEPTPDPMLMMAGTGVCHRGARRLIGVLRGAGSILCRAGV